MTFNESPLFHSKIGTGIWISVIVAKLPWNPLQPQDSALVGWGVILTCWHIWEHTEVISKVSFNSKIISYT